MLELDRKLHDQGREDLRESLKAQHDSIDVMKSMETMLRQLVERDQRRIG